MLRRLPVLLLALSLGVAACSSEPEAVRDESGVVETEGTVDAFDVEVGDCIEQPVSGSGETEQVESVTSVPCADPHDGEVYAAFDLPDGEFPGDEAVSTAGEDQCVEEFGSFIGMSYEESKYEITSLFPTRESWEQADDREYVCIAVDPEGAALTGSLEGVAE